MDLSQIHGVQVPVVSRHRDHMVLVLFNQIICQSRLVPSSSYLRVYMGCALALVLQVSSLYVP